MDVKRYINTRIWSDTWFEELEGIERLVWLYLLTNQQTNLIGIYEIGLKRISNESGVEINRLQTVMERFANDSKAFHNGRFVIIPNYLRNQTLANPNMEKSAKNLFDSLPQDVKKVLQSLGISDFEILKKGLPNRLQTVDKPFANRTAIESEREIESEMEREIEAALISASPTRLIEQISDELLIKGSVRYMVSPDDSDEPVVTVDQPSLNSQSGSSKKNQKPKPEIPTLEEFMVYAKEWMEKNEKDYTGKRAQLVSKYETWKTAGWKDGYGNQIKDWKGKIRNTEPHLKSDYAKSSSITRQAAREPQPGAGFGKL